jgi:hypothetical protein
VTGAPGPPFRGPPGDVGPISDNRMDIMDALFQAVGRRGPIGSTPSTP